MYDKLYAFHAQSFNLKWLHHLTYIHSAKLFKGQLSLALKQPLQGVLFYSPVVKADRCYSVKFRLRDEELPLVSPATPLP